MRAPEYMRRITRSMPYVTVRTCSRSSIADGTDGEYISKNRLAMHSVSFVLDECDMRHFLVWSLFFWSTVQGNWLRAFLTFPKCPRAAIEILRRSTQGFPVLYPMRSPCIRPHPYLSLFFSLAAFVWSSHLSRRRMSTGFSV